MLSAASSWLISSIFILYFLICSLMSISTHLWTDSVSPREPHRAWARAGTLGYLVTSGGLTASLRVPRAEGKRLM